MNKTANLDGASICLTGGTGSFGQAFVRAILNRFPKVKRLVVFSRDELKQYEMSLEFPEAKYPALRYFLGDVRDQTRLRRALEGVDTVVHAAALKQVPAAEYNPFEFIKTNVIGAQNLIEACLDSDVKRVVALSTDKAAAPVNLYGATKLCSDKLFISANNFKGARPTRFSVVRYGNVMGSRGSVIPFFLEQAKTGRLSITHKDMTRFNISLAEGVNMVIWALQEAHGTEILVPKIPSYRITDVAHAIGPSCKIDLVGVRPGEKLHEEMITESDSANALDLGPYYAILPPKDYFGVRKKYSKSYKIQDTPEGFSYNSGNNSSFLSVEALRRLIREHINPAFEPV